MVEDGDGERIDGSRRKKRISAALDGDDADAALLPAGDRGGVNGRVASSAVADVAEKDVVGKSRAEDLLGGSGALVELKIRISGQLRDRALSIGRLAAIALGHLIERAELDRMKSVGIEAVRELWLERRRSGNGSFVGRGRIRRGLLDRLAPGGGERAARKAAASRID